MKPWIKILIGVALGFGAGFGTGFFCHKKMNDIQFEVIDEEEMQQIEESLKKPNEKKEKDLPDIQDLPDDKDKLRMALQGKISYINADEKKKHEMQETWETVKEYSNEENANELPIDPEEGLDEEFLEMIEEEEVEPGQIEPPHIISLGEFYNERPEYDKITIDWYEPDNVYLDEREEIIGDIKTYVGLIASSLFKETDPGDDPDIRFVRNEQYGSDYEIIRHHRSYRETMGEG